MELSIITPVLRIFDEAVAREFYVEFLGFSLDWEHRFEPELPLYAQVSRGKCVLHLSGHFGDGSPGARVRIDCDDVETFQKELIAKQYKHARPSVETLSWGKELSIADPFGNRLVFWQRNAT
jgi:catechol 2,3-dioxygenase-like lactoylglutathione lyase family enzyme